ncbi:MAG: hypothetical protein AAF270_11980 [Pseudomonadota bacterium]
MRATALFLLCILPIAAQANDPFAGLDGDSEKAVYCFYTNTLRMQLQGAMGTDRTKASEILRLSERWQTVIGRLASDPMLQRNAMQIATTTMSQRMQPAGGSPQKMLNDVITPTMTACDVLLARLDPPQEPAKAAPAASPTPTTRQTGLFDKDVFDGLVTSPLRGKYRWNPHSSVYASVRTEGTFARARNGSSAFQLDFDSKITTLCVGQLIESHRSEDGYLMHLTVKPGTGEGCSPRVTRGLLFPIAFDAQPASRQLMLRLYDDQGRLITASRFTSAVVRDKRLDQDKLLGMIALAQRMESDNDDKRRDAKLANLQRDADFPRLEPFYDSCMNTAATINGVVGTSDYCVCMTYKFGVGGRIPEPEFASYTQDFSRLVDRFRIHTNDNQLYTRLAETCRSCSSPSGALHTGCAEMDTNLLIPANFAEMIQRLDQTELRLETSTFYKENFFVVYLQGYSDLCSDQIPDAVPFDYVVTEVTTDPYAGTFSNEIQRDRTYVARKHSRRYEEIYDKHSKMSPQQFTAALRQMAITSESDLRRNQSDLQARIGRETEKRVSVRKHLEQGCSSASVQRVYSNLDAMFAQ